MSASRREELDWLAFQYLTDELAPPDRAEFERLLASDLSAGEALAEAVELVTATRQALARPVPVRRPLLRWMGYAAAAGFVLWLAVGDRTPADRHEALPTAESVTPEHAVALAWSQLRTTNSLVEPDASSAWDEETTAMAEVAPFASMDDDGDVELPAWLMTLSTLEPGPSQANKPNGSG